MIYFMDTKTLVKDFTKVQLPKDILDCTFVIFSSRIVPEHGMMRIRYSNRIFYLLEDDMKYNIDIVKRELVDSTTDLNTLIKMMRETLAFPEKIFIILSTPKEMKTKFPVILGAAITEMFGYPVIDYKNHRYTEYKYNPKDCVDKLSYWTAHYNKLLIGENPHLLHEMKKKTKKNTLKKLGRYEKGMSNSEMNQILSEDGLPFHI